MLPAAAASPTTSPASRSAPVVHRRLARGSIAPTLDVRTIAPASRWSLVVPMSLVSGEPLHARDRRPAPPRRRDRAAVVVVTALAATAGGLALLLVL